MRYKPFLYFFVILEITKTCLTSALLGKVYGGGKEFQLEEIHALDYWKRNGRERPHIRETSFQSNHAEENGLYSRKLSTSTSCPSSNGIDKVESQDG